MDLTCKDHGMLLRAIVARILEQVSSRASQASQAKTEEAKWAANTPCPCCDSRCLKRHTPGPVLGLALEGSIRCGWCKWEIKGTLCP